MMMVGEVPATLRKGAAMSTAVRTWIEIDGRGKQLGEYFNSEVGELLDELARSARDAYVTTEEGAWVHLEEQGRILTTLVVLRTPTATYRYVAT